MLDLLLYDNLVLSARDVTEEESRDVSYLIDSDLDTSASEMFSLTEVVSETLVVETASASHFKHCQCYLGFSIYVEFHSRIGSY